MNAVRRKPASRKPLRRAAKAARPAAPKKAPARRSTKVKDVDVEALLRRRASQVDRELGRVLARLKDLPAHSYMRPPQELLAAMGYSLLAGGKRLRPVIAMEACVAAGGVAPAAFPAACALEMVHTYSLIHDDLPAMDDDDLRRGQPTLHKAFNEATAILAGDALLTDAFTVLCRARHNGLALVRELSAAAGSFGMVGGQLMDLQAEGKDPSTVDLPAIHRLKTGRMFVASAVMGGLSADAGDKELAALRTYGAMLGLAFQIADDVLDVTDVQGKGGKGVGRDERQDKSTYVKLYGLDGARQKAREAADRAITALKIFGRRGKTLAALASFSVERDR